MCINEKHIWFELYGAFERRGQFVLFFSLFGIDNNDIK